MTSRPPGLRGRAWKGPRAPAPTIRLRLTALYATVFLITGAGLLTVGYLLVRSNLRQRDLRSELARHGLRPDSRVRQVETSPYIKQLHAYEHQLLNQALHRLLLEYVVALVVMTLISAVIGWLLAGHALAPLRKIIATAQRVSGENLGERIALGGPADELRELADTFDRMLGRLDGTFASQRHFVANASHELRTPLAIMRTEVDVALADPDASAEELREMGEAVRDTVDRCERLIASLLLLARSEAAAGHEEPVDIATLAADCITDLWARAQEAHVQIRDDLEPAWTSGDPGLLERLVANLVDNGIHHNEPGGYLEVTTRTTGDRVELIVANGGPVIDPQRVSELAEPFRRLDRSSRGFGLGLSIVRSIAKAHQGNATLVAPATGGLEVHVSIPSRQAPTSGRARHADAVRGTGPGRVPAVSGDPQGRLTKS
jgi:signal transduction histidine kinase